jgi:hypothetical protein
LVAIGYQPTQAVLYRFSGCLTIDYEPIKRILTRFPLIELHTFASNDDENSNPFIAEIKKTGLLIHLPARELELLEVGIYFS